MNQLKSIDNKIIVKPYSPNLGGVVTGIDLSKEILPELNFIKDAFNQFQVLFFQNQSEIPPKLQVKSHYMCILPLLQWRGIPKFLKFIHIKIVKFLMEQKIFTDWRVSTFRYYVTPA